MTPKDYKQKFLDFFQSKQHTIIPSASLIPENDPTVLFITAGMQPLVPFLMGREHPGGKRLADCQRCIRTGDIDEVGDATHLTFFEMLGNWSLGDYFKSESIEWSWELLTSLDGFNLDSNRLAVTCFAGDADAPKDEEAAALWRKQGVSDDRIAFLGKKDNWWGPAGQTGPCGPDTEIFYWKPNDIPAPQVFDPEDENWVEIWNNVFMQYQKNADGTFSPLTQKNVDTGMGFERIVLTLQGKQSVYDTELFIPILNEIKKLSHKSYEDHTRSFRIIADHLKAATLIIGDERSVLPSNDDQGYVVRKLIRRSVRHGLQLGITQDFTASIANVVIHMYKDDYPILETNQDKVLHAITQEEQKFRRTINKGISLVDKKLSGLAIQKNGGYEQSKSLIDAGKIITVLENQTIELDAKWLFDMYQSHGMPAELVFEEIEQYKIVIHNKEKVLGLFNELFESHKELSRAGAEQKFKGGLSDNSEQTTKLHTATHLLNEALRKVIDPNIVQKGSNITAERLRFDFNFDRKLTPEEIKAVEDEVNAQIKKNYAIEVLKMSPQDAQKMGAQSEFGARYPDVVSVYKIGDYSLEICMGPHVNQTGDIGHFKIIKEESSAAGIRRIKAVVE